MSHFKLIAVPVTGVYSLRPYLNIARGNCVSQIFSSLIKFIKNINNIYISNKIIIVKNILSNLFNDINCVL
jgi:hypothetical protein